MTDEEERGEEAEEEEPSLVDAIRNRHETDAIAIERLLGQWRDNEVQIYAAGDEEPTKGMLMAYDGRRIVVEGDQLQAVVFLGPGVSIFRLGAKEYNEPTANLDF